MSQPIDELLISVEIEEGSNLEDLHKMLKEIRESGGKIEVEIPEDAIVKVGNKITAVNRRISQLIDVLKPIMAKFPDLIDTKDIMKDILTDLQKFITDFEEWSDDFKTKILAKLKKNLDEIRSIRGLMDKPTVTRVQVGRGVEEKLDQVFEIMAQQFLKILEILESLDGKFRSVRAHTTRRSNVVIAEIAKQLEELTDLMNAIDHVKNLVLTSFMRQFDYLFQAVMLMQKVSLDIERIGIKQGKMNDEILSIIERVGEIKESSDLDEVINEIAELFDITFKPALEKINDRLEVIYVNVKDAATQSKLQEMRDMFIDMRQKVEEQFGEFLRDYYDTTTTWERFATKLDKIPQDRTETRRAIEEHIDKLLVGFKDQLDKNIIRLIEPELNGFLDSLAAIVGEVEEPLRLPGMKGLGEPRALEDISGFWRSLIASLLTQSADKLKENVDILLQRDMSRRIQEMTPIHIKDIGRTLGIELSKSEEPKFILEKVLDAISGYDIADLLAGISTKEESLKLGEVVETPREEILNIIKRSELTVGDFRKVLQQLSTQIRDTQNQARVIVDIVNPTKKLVEDINAKLESKTAMEEADKRDMNRKTGVRE